MTITALARNFNGDPNMVTMVTTSSAADITTAGFWNLPATVADVDRLQNGVFQWSPTDFVSIYTSDGFGTYVYDFTNAAFAMDNAGGATVITPTQANYLAKFVDTNGTLGMSTGTLLSKATIITDPGFGFTSQPPFPGTGSLSLYAMDAGNFNIFINNDVVAQVTSVSIPDPLANQGKFLVGTGANPFVNKHLLIANGTHGVVIDSGAQLLSGTTAAYGGGGTSNAFTVTGLVAAAVGACVIKSSTNNVSVTKAVAGTNSLTVTFSADPGANTTLTYFYTTAAMA